MAFTIHFLSRDFTLAVKPILGKYSGDIIKNYMEEIIDECDLSKEKIVMMLRDSGSNMVKACKDWEIPHFPCIGHSLHLKVGPFLIEKRNKSRAKRSTRMMRKTKRASHKKTPTQMTLQIHTMMPRQ